MQKPCGVPRARTSSSSCTLGTERAIVRSFLAKSPFVGPAVSVSSLCVLAVCRIMALESFSNPECAAMLNDAFIPVIVDREERPDIDAIYMNYVQAVSNVGGWPLSLFLTSGLEPVFGGTFWPGPATSRRTMAEHEDESPDFLTILRKVHDIWRDQEARCRKEATEVVAQLREFAAEGTLGIAGQLSLTSSGWAAPAPAHAAGARDRDSLVSSELDLDQLEEACAHIASTYDPVNGGFGGAPKFLTPPKLAFLLQLQRYPSPVQDVVGQAECTRATNMAVETLRKIRDGSLHDHVGGAGFARCSATRDWSLPSFDKLVVDNALLLGLYLDAWRISGAVAGCEFFDVVGELVEYLTSEPIALPDGCVASSEAADSYYRRGDADMREGAWYLWTRREFDSVLDAVDRHISPVVAAHWDVQEDGNVKEDDDPNDDFINQNIPRVVKTPEELATQFSIPVETVEQYIQIAKRELKARRERERMRPALDNKIVMGWNGLVISALARAASALNQVAQAKAERCLITARAAVGFIRRRMWDPNAQILYRIWRDGRDTEAFSDDYAYLIGGLLDLFDATADESLLEFADTLQSKHCPRRHMAPLIARRCISANPRPPSPSFRRPSQRPKSDSSKIRWAPSSPRRPRRRTPSSASRTAWTRRCPRPTPCRPPTCSASAPCSTMPPSLPARAPPSTPLSPRCCSTRGCSRASWPPSSWLGWALRGGTCTSRTGRQESSRRWRSRHGLFGPVVFSLLMSKRLHYEAFKGRSVVPRSIGA